MKTKNNAPPHLPRRPATRGKGARPPGRKGKRDPLAARPVPTVNGGWAYARGARTRGAPRPPANIMGQMALCCSLVNPWDPRCRGCKLPDGNNALSMTTQAKGIISFTGFPAAVYAFNPCPVMSYTSVVPSGGVATWPALFSSYGFPAIFINNVLNYRVVCAGIRCTVVSSVPSSQGRIIISHDDATALPAGTRTTGTLDATNVETFPIVAGASWTVLFRRLGPPVFNGIGSTSTTGFSSTSGPPFSTIIFDMSGMVAATAVDFEYIFNVEYTYNVQSGLGHVAIPDPPSNPAAITRASHIAEKVPHVVSGEPNQFTAVVNKIATSAFEKGGEYLLEGLSALFI